jgi:hypothetical protein
VRLLRPLRLFVPLVAVGAALVVFLVFGFLAYRRARVAVESAWSRVYVTPGYARRVARSGRGAARARPPRR